MAIDLTLRREKTKKRIRGRIAGTPERPRLTIYKSLNRIYVQAVDDTKGVTLAAASSLEKDLRSAGQAKGDEARVVGRLIAERARGAGVERVVFDRAGYRYHGRIKSLADAAREAGLEF